MYTIAIILTAIGGVNWGLVGLFDLNIVSLLFGTDTIITNIIYVIVGAAALYLIIAHLAHMGEHERQGHRGHRPVTAHH